MGVPAGSSAVFPCLAAPAGAGSEEAVVGAGGTGAGAGVGVGAEAMAGAVGARCWAGPVAGRGPGWPRSWYPGEKVVGVGVSHSPCWSGPSSTLKTWLRGRAGKTPGCRVWRGCGQAQLHSDSVCPRLSYRQKEFKFLSFSIISFIKLLKGALINDTKSLLFLKSFSL